MSAATPPWGPYIDLDRPGPPADDWNRLLAGLPPFDPPDGRRIVVVVAHPDDETFGAGGLLHTHGGGALVLCASAAGGPARERITAARTRELAEACAALRPGGDLAWRGGGFRDGALREYRDAMTRWVGAHVRPGDLVLTHLPDDGHPDHWAVAGAAVTAARSAGIDDPWGFPIWAWHCHDPSRTSMARGYRLALDEGAAAAKTRAAFVHATQVGGDPPVLPPHALERFLTDREVFVPLADRPHDAGGGHGQPVAGA